VENDRVVFLRAKAPPSNEAADFRDRMRETSEALRSHQIAEIILIHGTFVGGDALGLLRELARVSPGLSKPIRAFHKQALEHLLQDAGNFTTEYAETFEEALSAGFETPNPSAPLELE
jgi:DNA-binding PucR family transcriptional regulator